MKKKHFRKNRESRGKWFFCILRKRGDIKGRPEATRGGVNGQGILGIGRDYMESVLLKSLEEEKDCDMTEQEKKKGNRKRSKKN